MAMTQSPTRIRSELPNCTKGSGSSEVTLSDADIAALKDKGYKAALLWHTSSDFTNAVTAGAGIGVIHHFMAEGEKRLVPVLPETVSITRSFWLLVHADLKDVARVRAIVDFVVREVKASRGLLMGEPRPEPRIAAE